MAKHFMIFNNGGLVSATTPKDWARAHQNAFPNHTFADGNTTPTTDTIEAYLKNSLGYQEANGPGIVVLYRLGEL